MVRSDADMGRVQAVALGASRRPLRDDGTVVGRAVAILDRVSESAGPLRLTDLARLTGIPKPTVHRIASDLVVRGMLEHTRGGYLTGARLMTQGMHAAVQRGYITTIQPVNRPVPLG